ncbi:ArsR/SmtB family transcription factor [Histidinibacterium aquaticum]|uniref:Winged helix-turn-helix transcriptional regulator n=1 Tax=Histidinibacterium aquaticum TaxID=2613962 RepID=A0A5J5GPG6_9RHOB|nr:metalloregulator ArsR/SmtB family transcription factor [Histidinibacterium aquaticum]KAA9010276.1 winged helix-turn-helix transcriptional regulator [Histidinibacterium aquaticum]
MLDPTLAALSDPNRRAILARLAEGEATVAEIAAPLPISQPAVSHHLKVLEEAGLILRRVDGQRRPCRIAPDALAPLEAWITRLRSAMEHNYQHLDAILAEAPEGD